MATALMQLTRQLPREALRQLAGAGVERLRSALGSAQALPEVPGCTLGLLRDPYRFVMRQCARLGSDAFAGRLLWRRTVFLMGEDAALLFYNPHLMQRAGAAPLRLQRLLFGKGGLQGLDGPEHRRRKALFLEMVASPGALMELSAGVGRGLREAAVEWRDGVDFHLEMRRVLTRAACFWAGLPLADDEVDARCEQLSALFEPGLLFGPPLWRAWWRRRQAERWCRAAIAAVREGEADAPPASPLARIARYRDAGGHLLPPATATAELLNVLRPVVAVGVYAVYIALALQAHPRYRERLRRDEGFLPLFVQEVRRFYPFFPQLVARSRTAFEWNGLRIPAGVRVVLDVYGTNHDVRAWEAPDDFHPERFLAIVPGAYAFIPQGGGDAHVHHRCPGEALTLALMQDVARFLARELDFRIASPVALQWHRLPPLPEDALRLADVVLYEAAALPAPGPAAGAPASRPGRPH